MQAEEIPIVMYTWLRRRLWAFWWVLCMVALFLLLASPPDKIIQVVRWLTKLGDRG